MPKSGVVKKYYTEVCNEWARIENRNLVATEYPYHNLMEQASREPMEQLSVRGEITEKKGLNRSG